ncbi:MAG: PEP-CTERM sorting domain-containing protein [Rhodocyclaceae bacterium]
MTDHFELAHLGLTVSKVYEGLPATPGTGTAVPEPASFALALLAACGLLLMRRQRKQLLTGLTRLRRSV